MDIHAALSFLEKYISDGESRLEIRRTFHQESPVQVILTRIPWRKTYKTKEGSLEGCFIELADSIFQKREQRKKQEEAWKERQKKIHPLDRSSFIVVVPGDFLLYSVRPFGEPDYIPKEILTVVNQVSSGRIIARTEGNRTMSFDRKGNAVGSSVGVVRRLTDEEEVETVKRNIHRLWWKRQLNEEE
jgi:hypothetical protein